MWDSKRRSPAAPRSKARDPHRLRVNSYRVLLTRGRDGFFIFVPNEVGMAATYSALVGAGVKEVNQNLIGVEKGNEKSILL